MDERHTAHDGRVTAGRKGIPYDWRGVLAAHLGSGHLDANNVGAGQPLSHFEPQLVSG
jgi:hypothetical protein